MPDKNSKPASERAADVAAKVAANAPAPEPPVARPNPVAGDMGAAEVQENMDEEQEKGYRGDEADPTPDYNYTVAGVTSGAPTPETDPALAAEVQRKVGLGPEARLDQIKGGNK